jgi:membrane associated rhomboid family serine protease
MFPLRDNIPSRYTPYGSKAIIGLNALVYIFGLTLSQRQLAEITHVFGVVPARYFHPSWAEWIGYPDTSFLPFLTHMFLHGGFFHFVVNMWILWVFGDNVEDVMGTFRFILFYLASGLCALAGHVLFNTSSTLPVIGASGAVAGVMGAYFLLYPRAQVLTLIPIFIFPFFIDLPAVVFLGLWFGIQILSGMLASISAQTGGGVAWWAHAFGFLGGILLLRVFRHPRRFPR